jgi:hypothetical protein
MLRIGEYRIEITVFSEDTQPVAAVVAYQRTATARQVVDLKRSNVPFIPPATLPGDLKETFKGNELA